MPEINVEIQIEAKTLRASVNVPEEPVRPLDLLPIFQGFSSAVVDAASEGLPVTCRRGCSACCRQIVPVSVTEAINLINVIDEMPPERKAIIMERFRDAKAKIEAAGLLTPFKPGKLTNMDVQRDVALRYFYLGLPCPFLENDACSIYEDRPLSCREYLAVSPPPNCSDPANVQVETLIMPKKLSFILYNFGDGVGNDGAKVIPLTLIFDYQFPEQPLVPGVEQFRNFFVAFKEQML